MYKKKSGILQKIAIFLLCIAMMIPPVSARAEETTFKGVTTSTLYVRPEKGSNDSLGVLQKGEEVSGVVDGAWLKIKYGEETAYVAKQFVVEKADDKIVGYTTSSLYIRPSKGSKKSLGILAKGETITGKIEDDWIHFLYNGKDAYIAKAFVHRVDTSGKEVTGYTTSSIYVRSTPGSKYSLGILDKGTKVTGYETGAWLLVNYKGQVGYIAKAFVQDTKPEEGGSTQPVSLSGLTTSSLFVRPSKGSRRSLGILGKGEAVSGTVEGQWLHIKYKGQDGYIAKAFVKEVDTSNKITGYTSSSLFVRPKPGSRNSLGILSKGTKVTGYENGAWLLVNYNNQAGYIAKAFVQDTKPEESEPEQGEDIFGITTSSLYVRPYKGSRRSLGILPQGVTVKGVVEGGWVRFTYNKQTAYVAKAFVEEVDTSTTTTGYTSSSLYVRPKPGSRNNLGVLAKGTKVTGYETGPWLLVNYNNRAGYIAKAFVLSEPPEEDPDEGRTFSAMTTSSLYVRPFKGSRRNLGILPKGRVVEGKVEGDWFHFSYKNQDAYIAKAFIEEVDTSLPMTGYTTSSLYVRPKPGSKRSLGILDKGTKVTGFESGAWLMVKYKNRVAYIAKAFIQSNPPEPSQPTSDGFTGITTSSLYIRPFKGSNQNLGIMPKGEPIKGVVEGNWIRFTYNGQDAYLAKAFVKETDLTGRVTGYTSSSLYVRPFKGSKSKLGILPAGAKVIGYESGAWVLIKYNNQNGYIAKAFVQDNPPSRVQPNEPTVNPVKPDGSHKIISGYMKTSGYLRPSKGSKKSLTILSAGTYVEGYDLGAWLQVNYNGQAAYLAKFLVGPYQRRKPKLKSNERFLIDISYYQKPQNIDYDRLAKEVDGVIIRVGYTGHGTGKSYYKDSAFERHYREFTKRGIPVGGYWYACADCSNLGKAEANFMLNCIRGKNFQLPLYWDTEDTYHQSKVSRAQLTDAGKAFVKRIEQAGYKAGIYGPRSWLNNRLSMNQFDCSVWVAEWGVPQTIYAGPYDIWQCTNDCRLPGYNGPLDGSILYL